MVKGDSSATEKGQYVYVLDAPHTTCSCDSRENVMDNVIFDDAVEQVPPDQAEIAIDGTQSTLPKRPRTVLISGHIVVCMVKKRYGN